MAGNQVLEWADLDTEIKTAKLKDVGPRIRPLIRAKRIDDAVSAQDPLAPPDL